MIISFSKENNVHVRMLHHEYANEADDDVPKPAQSLGTPVPRQKICQNLKNTQYYSPCFFPKNCSENAKNFYHIF